MRSPHICDYEYEEVWVETVYWQPRPLPPPPPDPTFGEIIGALVGLLVIGFVALCVIGFVVSHL